MRVFGRLLLAVFSINMGSKFLLIPLFFLLSTHMLAQEYILFINGYRGPKHDAEITNNQIHQKDPTGYWYAIDDSIKKRFPSAKALYLDAHHPISTSTHLRMGKAVRSYIFSRFCWIRRKSKWVLNTQPNPNGFDIRVENGAKAGKLLLRYFEENPATKIHVVCHSMGYAYFLGIIDILAPTQTFGKALILSPEAASTASRDWTIFEEIWQYGANADVREADPIFLQDGIAPQQAVPGLDQLKDPTKGGRIYIPNTYPKSKLGFIKSHHLAYYDWFFWIKPTDPGYFSAD
ncbi:MAG: hypothetical protein RIT34_637 [Bacteroidota bacterium]|jgi:hypothetical protein